MSKQQLTGLLDRLQITLQPELTSEILSFLPTLPPSAGKSSWKMRAIAGAALRADVAQVSSVGGEGRVSYGAPLQQFLRHVGREEKLQFLEAVEGILADWKQAPQDLRVKFQEVRRTYAVFRHFRALFGNLTRERVDDGVAYRTMAVFWIVFLRAKSLFAWKCRIGGEAVELELMLALVEFAIGKIGVGVGEEAVREAFCWYFERDIVVAKQLQEFYQKQFQEIIEEHYNSRDQLDTEIDFRALIKNEDRLRRFVDSFCKKFEHKNGGNFSEINELNYLQLDLPPLTPQPQPQSRTPSPPTAYQITKVLNFEEESEDQSGNCSEAGEQVQKNTANVFSKPLQNCENVRPRNEVGQIFKRFLEEEEQEYAEVQRRRKKFVINKCQTRIFILKWVQDEIRATQGAAQGLLEEMRETFDVREYELVRGDRIMALLEMVCSACKDKFHRSGQVYRLFLAFLLKMRRSIKREDFLHIVSNPHYLDAFLCLTCVIFNFAYKTLDLSFEEYCHHFGITILTGFVPLNWLGVNADLPKQLQLFLFELQERILFEQLWRGEAGFELFRPKGSSNFIQMAIRKRLFKHLAHRIALICKNDITDKERSTLFKFIEEILVTRLHLLRENTLYVIVICSINYCFGKVFSLNKVFDSLRKNEHIAKVALQARDSYGYSIPIEEFYSNVFMREMEPIIAARKQLLLVTPLKMTPPTAVRNTSSGRKPSIAIQKYRFGEDSFSESRGEGEGVGHYRKQLAVKIFQAPCQSYPKSCSSSELDE